jgi:predicted dehydrogenase
MTVRLGVVGCGRVFSGPYMRLIEPLQAQGRVEVTAVCDTNAESRRTAADRLGLDPGIAHYRDVVQADDVDLVCVFTSMLEHGPITLAGLEAGKHVLVEKPMATTLEEADALLEAAETNPGILVCAPHILLSPAYQALHRRVLGGEIGRVLSARARYGWAGPWWGPWFYRHGGGALFDLGIYNVTSLCGLIGPARRVTAMTGVVIPERVVDGAPVRVEAEDTAHVLIDFGESVFAVVTTGFTMQRYRSPAIELYGSEGTIQLLGDDWAPEGLELWRNDVGAWQLFPDPDPGWPWTDGLRHLVECIETGAPTITRPEHAYHALEIILAAQAAGADGRAREIRSGFPPPIYAHVAEPAEAAHLRHDPRSG